MKSWDLSRPSVTLAVMLGLILVVVAISLKPLIPVDETRYLTVAWEMFNSGNWLVPHLNGQPYSHKPPMLFWVINFAWFLTGAQSEFIARIAPGLFLPFAAFLTQKIAIKIVDKREAATAAVVLVGFATFSVYSSLVMFDAMLACSTIVAVMGLVDASQAKPIKGFLLFGISIGFGLLVKGPAILIHVLPAALLAPLWVSQTQRWAVWYASVVASLALGVSIGLSWAIPAAQAGGPEYCNMILWGQTTGRIVNSFDHARPAWFYVAILPLLLFPWILSRNLWKQVVFYARGGDRLERLPWIVTLGSLILFSLVSGKQIHYLIPAMPFAAIIVARTWRRSTGLQLQEYGFSILMLFLAGFTLSLTIFPTFAERLHMMINPWISILFLGLAVVCWFLKRDLLAAGTLSTVGIFVVVHLAGFMGGFSQFDLDWLGSRLRDYPNAPVAFDGRYQGQIGYLGRIRNPVTVLNDGAAAGWLQHHSDGVLVSEKKNVDPSLPVPDMSMPYRHSMLNVWLPAK